MTLSSRSISICGQTPLKSTVITTPSKSLVLPTLGKFQPRGCFRCSSTRYLTTSKNNARWHKSWAMSIATLNHDVLWVKSRRLQRIL